MLTITKFSIKRFPLQLRESYTIAYQTVSNVENILFVVTLSDGFEAIGVTGPEEEVTGESIDSTEKLLNEIIAEDLFRVSEIDAFLKLWPALKEKYHLFPAMLASIDFAILSLKAHSKGKSIAQFLKVEKKSLPTTITINIHSPEETLKRATNWLKQGFTMLKIKGGLSIEEDLSKLSLLRNKFKVSLPILFDANQGYKEDEAKYFLKQCKKLDLIAIEQPVHKDEKELLLSLAGEKSTPIMADEAACSLKDVTYLASKGVQYFNIKLMKCGGTENGILLAHEIVKHGKKMIFSCMDECALSNAYSLATALSIPQITWVDLDSFTDYTKDPTSEALSLQKGKIAIRI